jgi:hypothetical protein
MGSDPDVGFQQRIEQGRAMEYYSYVNIFETKGLAYLLLLSFLVLGVLLIRYLSGPERKEAVRRSKSDSTNSYEGF